MLLPASSHGGPPVSTPLENALGDIVRNIWSVVLGLEVRPASGARAPDAGPTLTATVDLTGGWEGSIDLRCGWTAAEKAAGAMFRCPPGKLSPADVRDALGELTNITAGNFKALFAPRCALLVPRVREDGANPDGASLCTLAFTGEDGPFQVSVRGSTLPGGGEFP